MTTPDQKRFPYMVRMLQIAFPKDWEKHLHNLGVTASANPPPADLDRIMEHVFWMVRQTGIKDPAAWIAFDMAREEAASASVEPEAPLIAFPVAVPQNRVELEPVKLGTDLAKTSGASPLSSEIASASVRPVRQDPVEFKPVRLGTDLAKNSGASPPALETVIKEPAARIAFEARVKAAFPSVGPEAPLKVASPVAVRQHPAELEPVNLGVDLVKTSNAWPMASETATVIARLLSQAKLAIEADRPREAAAAMFIAHEKFGATQQEVAEAVGKSQAWVSCMLRWDREGLHDTPFGPASRDARMVARIGRRIGRRVPRGVLRRWTRRDGLAPPRVAAGTKDDAHASVSSGVLVIGVIQPECPELPLADIKGSENNASGWPIGSAK
jgi:hypothetical protein